MNEQTRLARSAHAAPFTAGDFLRMLDLGAFADMRAELVRGNIEKMMPANWTHGELHATVAGLLFPVARASGARIGTDVVLRIDDATVRAPDLVMLRPHAEPERVLHGAQILLAIEIADTTLDRDMADKRVDYACAGVANYWVIDPSRRVVHVFGEVVDGDYAQVSTVRFDAPLAIPGTDASIAIG